MTIIIFSTEENILSTINRGKQQLKCRKIFCLSIEWFDKNNPQMALIHMRIFETNI